MKYPKQTFNKKTIKQLKKAIQEHQERLKNIEATYREHQYFLDYLKFRLEQEQCPKEKIEYAQ
jgi:hypothetical protein